MTAEQVARTVADATFKRLATLSQDKAASDQDLDDIRVARDAAVADVEVAKAKIASAQADLDAAKAAIAVAGRQLEVAKADAARIDTLVGYMRIVAPFDGVVTRRLVNRGVLAQAATATAGAPLLTVQRTDLMRVLVDVPEADAAKVGPGTPTEVVPYGLGPGLAAGYAGGMIGRQGREDRRRGEGNIQHPTSKFGEEVGPSELGR